MRVIALSVRYGPLLVWGKPDTAAVAPDPELGRAFLDLGDFCSPLPFHGLWGWARTWFRHPANAHTITDSGLELVSGLGSDLFRRLRIRAR